MAFVCGVTPCFYGLVEVAGTFRACFIVAGVFIATEEAKLHLGFLPLCDLDFYGNPVELEVVDALLLGFSVDVHQRIVQYRQPDLRQI